MIIDLRLPPARALRPLRRRVRRRRTRPGPHRFRNGDRRVSEKRFAYRCLQVGVPHEPRRDLGRDGFNFVGQVREADGPPRPVGAHVHVAPGAGAVLDVVVLRQVRVHPHRPEYVGLQDQQVPRAGEPLQVRRAPGDQRRDVLLAERQRLQGRAPVAPDVPGEVALGGKRPVASGAPVLRGPGPAHPRAGAALRVPVEVALALCRVPAPLTNVGLPRPRHPLSTKPGKRGLKTRIKNADGLARRLLQKS